MRNQIEQEELFRERILGIRTMEDFNNAVARGKTKDLINICETLQERKIAHIADEIQERITLGDPLRFILVSGPSSSGKTTFSKRLRIQLMALGLSCRTISLDDYFLDRENTPKDENGELDYESLYSLDLDFFDQQMQELSLGKEVELPTFNFTLGKREFKGRHLKLDTSSVLILEGIHALNPELTKGIQKEQRYGIYVSALTRIRLNDTISIPRRDNRLIRRIVRDAKFRNYTAEETILRWPSVRRGEEKWIFPFEETANAHFNSSLHFELSALKGRVVPLLFEVDENSPAYEQAQKLLSYFKYIYSIESQDIPLTSLLREFVGGSSFHY